MIKERILGFIIGTIYKFYSFTFRYHVHFESEEAKEAYRVLKHNKPHSRLYAVWHQDEMSVFANFKNCGVNVMVSLSNDGTILASALHAFGYKTIRGSSNKSPLKAFLGSLKALQEGEAVAIAVDGPRGPIYQTKEGVIKLASMSKALICPVRAIPVRYHEFEKSWSRSRLPLPFTRIDLYVGTPRIHESCEALNKHLMSLSN